MTPHSSTLAWKIPWPEEPGGLPSMGSQRVGHDWVTSLSLFTFMHWRRKWQPTPVFLPGESQGWRSLVGCCLWGRTESDMTEATQQQQQQVKTSIWYNPVLPVIKEEKEQMTSAQNLVSSTTRLKWKSPNRVRLWDLMKPTRLLCPWNAPGKNSGMGSRSLLQGTFLTQRSNLGLPHCRRILYHLTTGEALPALMTH